MDQPVAFDEDPPPEPRDGWLLVRIHVPELNVYKCLQFPSERLVWDVKQQVLASLPKVAFWFRELKEHFNYGLFCPPLNGKAGKFLDEERRLGDYPFNGPVGYLELKYKRRVYKMLNLDEKQLKAVHTRANLRRFLECINGGHVDKIAKMCAKGLDPNFHCPETGDTPLTLATGAKKPNKLLIALVNGGALLDYRTKDGTTALHRAVERDCLEAVTTLLELGASPNYKDSRGLTPLYLSVTKKTDSKICESLLHDHGTLGIQDSQGWQEVHQACRHGLAQHLEHLLFYGADMDGHNASGNTSLHVCALNNQEACARMLLFRGAQREALNYANQTPSQVAVIAGNMELAEMIQNYKSEDIVPFRGPPRYNPRRRSGIGWGTTLSRIGGPPSPCPSEHPFSSASSSLSEGSSSHRSHEDDISIVTDKSIGDTSDIISDSSGVGTNSDSAACSIGHPSTTVVCMQPYCGSSLGHLSLQPGDVIDVVGSTDCGLLEGFVRGLNRSGFFPEHCVQEVNIRQKNIHNVSTGGGGGLGVATTGVAVGEYRGTVMMQPQQQQQQPQQHHHQQSYSSATAPRIKKSAMPDSRTVVLHRAQRGFGFILRGAKAASPLMQLKPSDRCPGLQYLDHVDPGGVADMAGLRPGDFLLEINGEDVRCASHEQVVDLIRNAKSLVSMTVVSQNFPNNFQHQINSQQQQHQQQQQQQYAPAGLYQPNGSGQSAARQCATLPRKLNSAAAAAAGGRSPAPPQPPRRDPKTTLSVGRARAKSMVAGLENGGEKRPDQMAAASGNSSTLLLHAADMLGADDDCCDVYGSSGGHGGGGGLGTVATQSNQSSSAESIHQYSLASSASTPTQAGPGTPVQPRTASIKARPTSSRITAAELEELFQRQQGETGRGEYAADAGSGPNGSSCSMATGGGGGSVNAHRYSTMMSSSRFQSGCDSGPATPPAAASPLKASNGGGGGIVYASVADMKRKKAAASAGGPGGSGGSKAGTLRGKPCAIPTVSTADLRRNFHSTPDLAALQLNSSSTGSGLNSSASSVWSSHTIGGGGGNGGGGGVASYNQTIGAGRGGKGGRPRSQDDMRQLQQLVHAQSMQRLVLPAPTHPPPPPPVGQVVKVDVSRGAEYESTVRLQKQLQDKKAAAANAAAAAATAAASMAAATKAAGGANGSAEDGAEEVRSSFKPAANAKLYASPQDIRTVGFRSRVEPPSAARHQLRKSLSLRSDTDSTPAPLSPTVSSRNTSTSSSTNSSSVYAQPGYATTNSVPAQQQRLPQITSASPPQPIVNNSNGNNAAAANQRCHTMPTKMLHAPPIPDPDYSLSESDGETENSILVAHNTKMNAQIGQQCVQLVGASAAPPLPPPMMPSLAASNVESSANSHSSNSSNASNNSGSMSHSFSVDEIQKMRVKLKSSKSYPNDLLARQQQQLDSHQQQLNNSQMHLLGVERTIAEDGDNSSSGVSSDQEIQLQQQPPIPPMQTQPPQPHHAPAPILKTSQAYQQQHSLQSYANNSSSSYPKTATVAVPVTSSEFGHPKKPTQLLAQQQQQQQHHQHQHSHHLVHQHQHHAKPVKTIDMDREAALQAAAAAADDDRLDEMDSPSPPSKGFQRHNSLTRKQAATIAMQRAQQSRSGGGGASSSIVSLVKLPPPIESDDDQDETDHQHHHQPLQQHQQHYNLRRPKQQQQHQQPLAGSLNGQTAASLAAAAAAAAAAGPATTTEHIVLAPPPQFCDCVHTPVQLTTTSMTSGLSAASGLNGGSGRASGVRIVGALPK